MFTKFVSYLYKILSLLSYTWNFINFGCNFVCNVCNIWKACHFLGGNISMLLTLCELNDFVYDFADATHALILCA